MGRANVETIDRDEAAGMLGTIVKESRVSVEWICNVKWVAIARVQRQADRQSKDSEQVFKMCWVP